MIDDIYRRGPFGHWELNPKSVKAKLFSRTCVAPGPLGDPGLPPPPPDQRKEPNLLGWIPLRPLPIAAPRVRFQIADPGELNNWRCKSTSPCRSGSST